MNRETRVHRSLCLGAAALLAAALMFGLAHRASRSEAAQPTSPKYLFIFLADGAGITHLEITRLFARQVYNEGLTISDRIMKEGSVGLLTTHAANSLVTDSSAAGTALALGCKTENGTVGICEDGRVPKSVLELAKQEGMRIGLITTATVYDASPAAFAGHVNSRRLYGPIVDQYLKLEPDILFGGGRDEFLPKGQPGSRRTDDTDVIALFRKKGYAYASDLQGLSRLRGEKALGLFSLRDMSFELDRDATSEPSLSDMTQAAVGLLQEGNRRGFALFIENENVDSAGHITDIASLIHAYREFDRAVAVAYDFYRKHHSETLILVTSDHETGGLGFSGSPSFEQLKKIRTIRISLSRAAEMLGFTPSAEAVDQLVAENFKGFVLSPELKEAILKKKTPVPPFRSNPTVAALSAMVTSQTGAYWISTGHTNQPVFVAALGVGSERFRGYQDNTDFAKHLIALLERREG